MIGDDTAVLLAIGLPTDEAEHRQSALDAVSEAVITRFALRAKADAYQLRIDRYLVRAADLGATMDDLAAAAGMSTAEVAARLDAARSTARSGAPSDPVGTTRPGGGRRFR